MTTDAYTDHMVDGRNGVCLDCGVIVDGGVEPHAQGYVCGDCGANAVMGIERALLKGHIVVEQETAP